ncbi:MAG: hypothetical protein ACK4YU_04910 [Paracoccus sp. (in: a-proteobacteria)]
MSDKDVVVQLNTFAQKRVRRDLATRADLAAALNFDERPDAGLSAHLAPIKVDKFGTRDPDIGSKITINDGHAGFLVEAVEPELADRTSRYDGLAARPSGNKWNAGGGIIALRWNGATTRISWMIGTRSAGDRILPLRADLSFKTGQVGPCRRKSEPSGTGAKSCNVPKNIVTKRKKMRNLKGESELT